MRSLVIFISIIVLLLTSPQAVLAQETNGCRPVFGGGNSCQQEGDLVLDKKMKSPATDTWLDQVDITDPKFSPGQQVVFQISVRNTGKRVIEDSTVTDMFPQYVRFTRGPGTFDQTTNTLTVPVSKIESGKAYTFTIEGTIGAAGTLPSSSGVLCSINVASVKQGRNTSSDNTQFCIQTNAPQANQNQAAPNQTTPATPPVQQGPNVSVAPKTGPEALALIGLLPTGAAGIYLRRKTVKG